MDQSDDLPLQEPQPEFSEPPSRPNLVVLGVVLVVGLVVVAALLGWWRSRVPAKPVAPATVAATEQEVAPSPELGARAEPIELPPLDASDAIVRKLVRELSSHPEVAAFLATDDLIRKFLIVVDNIAEGATPAGGLQHVAPKERFAVAELGDDLIVDPRSYARYDRHAAAIGAIDAAGAARLYTTLKPLLAEAYREFGRDHTVDVTVERAFRRLLSTPVPEDPVVLVPHGARYRFADARLEALSPAQKHFLRMGPTNARIVQGKLREIAQALGVPLSRP